MNMKLLLFSLALSIATLTGCVSTVDGKHKAGIPLASDSVESRYNRSVPQAFQAAKSVLAQNGVITVENIVGNTLEAKVEKSTVWVLVESLAPNETRVVVQARGKVGTDKALAIEMDKQIAVRLATGNMGSAPARSR